jgi:phosphoribosylformylglycinamidine synthase
VAEAWRNLTAVGARPLAVTDNLNFGNPERPEIMAQFTGCIEGMAEACRALDFPVVSGNVSFYNETQGRAILPTPVIGAVGVLDDAARAMTPDFKAGGEDIVVIGETRGHLGASLYLQCIAGVEAGAPPPVALAAERAAGDLVRALIGAGELSACHDVSDGGILVAVAEMALAGDIGAEITVPAKAPDANAWLFGEDQGRYVVTAPDAAKVLAAARDAGVAAAVIGGTVVGGTGAGSTGGAALTVSGADIISLKELRDVHEGWLPRYMAAP